jgi:hypothetical protein
MMGFVKAFFDDREKSINPAHVVALMLVTASIGWITFLVFKNHVLPDLQGVAYLLGGSGAMNVASKMEDIVGKLKPQAAPVVVPTPMVPPPMVPPHS